MCREANKNSGVKYILIFVKKYIQNLSISVMGKERVVWGGGGAPSLAPLLIMQTV